MERRIHSLLEDSSYPSMLLFDGAWGVGKTFYVKNSLKPYLEKEYSSSYKSYYLSLYGVSSLDDFKDRLLSVAYTKQEKTTWLARQSNAVADFSVQAFEGTRGVGKALGSIGSIVKQHYFNGLDKLLLFIDDLERLSCDKLKSEILGECLNLCENKNIKILVIGNQEKIRIKTDIEKAFSDVVSFSRTPSELISVLDQIYTGNKSLSEHQKQQVEEIISKYKVSNIRVIRRAIDRYNVISNLFTREAGLDYMQIDNNNFIVSFATCIAIYHHGFDLDEVIKTLDENPYMEYETKGQTDEDKRTDLIRSLIHPIRHHANENHIRFIATYENNFRDMAVEFKLPVEANELQEMLDYKFRKNDDEWFALRLPELKKFIEKPKPTEFATWSRACSVYVFLIENCYINDNEDAFILKARDILKVFTFTSSEEIKELRRVLRHYSNNKNLHELISEFLSSAISSTENVLVNSYKEQLVISWANVADRAREEYRHTPFLHLFERQDFELMFKNWSNNDIDDFDSYMRNRYDFGNIEDFFSDELNALKILSDSIVVSKEKLTHGARCGILSELELQISSIYKRLKEKVEAKEETTN